MKKFIINCLLFALVVVVACCAIFVLNLNYYRRVETKIDPSKNILFLGDSRLETSLNDTIFSRGFNFAASGEHMFFSWQKAKLLVEANKQIDTIVVSYNAANAPKKTDEFLSREVHGMHGRDRLAYFLPLYSHLKDIYQFLPFRNFTQYYYRLFIEDPIYLYLIYRKPINKIGLGGYLWLERDRLGVDTLQRRDKYREGIECYAIDSTLNSYKYLRQLKKFCDEKGVHLIIVNPPVYRCSEYFAVDKFEAFRREYLSDIDYLDFGDFPFDLSCYGDVMHLNHKGATIFSDYLNKYGLTVDSMSRYSNIETKSEGN